jgi:hypothetical protein
MKSLAAASGVTTVVTIAPYSVVARVVASKAPDEDGASSQG